MHAKTVILEVHDFDSLSDYNAHNIFETDQFIEIGDTELSHFLPFDGTAI
jgi:hypothetical protein